MKPTRPDRLVYRHIQAYTYRVVQEHIKTATWVAMFPGAAISVGVLGSNLLGDALRDVLDPRLRGTGRA